MSRQLERCVMCDGTGIDIEYEPCDDCIDRNCQICNVEFIDCPYCGGNGFIDLYEGGKT